MKSNGAVAKAPDSRSDAELMQDYIDGDKRAFDEIVLRYRAKLIRFVYGIIDDVGKTEDLIQETFLRVHRSAKQYDQTRKFSTWIYTIASNLARNELRNKSRDRIVFFQAREEDSFDGDRYLSFVDAESPSPEKKLDAEILRQAIEVAINKLTRNHKIVFVLREIENLPYREIGLVVGCRVGTVKSRLNRARNTFRELIAPFR